MPKIPEIQFNDIVIAEKYAVGFDYDRSKSGLWSIYNVIKKIHNSSLDNILKVLECLLFVGVHGEYDEMQNYIIYSGKTNKKYKRSMPSSKYLFALEKVGFTFCDLVTEKEFISKSKLTVKDIVRFRLTYQTDDFNDVIYGLKLFSDICMKQQGDCFLYGDIRVAFAGASKLYAPPVDEIFYFLPDEQKAIAYAVHQKLEDIGCVRSLEREYMTRYKEPTDKSKTFATIYSSEKLYFLPEFDENQKLVFNLNLRNINNYIDYLPECTQSIQQSVINTPNCGGCEKKCDGVVFTYQNKKYKKCPFYCFRFFDLSKEALENYMKLIDFENDCFKGGK